LGNLVGLLGGLEGRVAGVVLELVGCGGISLVSIPYRSAHVERSSKPLPSFRVQSRAHIRRLRAILLSPSRASRKVNNRGGGVRTVGKSGGERVDAVCDDQACD
jgi:hypothetical protein